MPNELHLSLFPGLNFVRDEQGHWRTEADENAPIEDPAIKAVASRLPAAPHQPGLSELFTAAAKSVLPLFRTRPSVTSSLLETLTNESVKDDSPVEGPDHETHLLDLFRQSDELRLLGLQEGSYERLRDVSVYVRNLDPFIRPKFEAYATIAQAQSHLAGGDLDTARSVLTGGPQGDPRVNAMLRAVEGAYAVRQSERIIQVVSAAALIAQKRVGGFENWANDGRPRARIMEGLQGWAREYRSLVENGTPALEAFERLKFWVMDLDHVGHVMNEEGLWNVVGEIGAMDVHNENRPDERMNATLLRVGDSLRDRHEGEAASHLYGILENAVSYRDSARARMETLGRDLREGEIRRFLRGLTPWTAERPEDFYGTLITVGTMAITGGVAGAAGRYIAAEAGSALLGRVVSIGLQSFTQPGLNAAANGVYNDGMSGLFRGLDPVADGTYMTQAGHNAVLMGGLGLGHFAATRLGGGLLTNLGVSVAGMTTFDLIADPRNREVSPGLLIANSLGNDLIGRASGGAQRGLEAVPGLALRGIRASANVPGSAKILAAAALALQGCDAQSAIDMIPALGMTFIFGSWAAMVVPRAIHAFRSGNAEGPSAPRNVEPAQPLVLPEEVPAEATGIVEAHERPELLTPARARPVSPLTRMIRELFLGTDRPFRVERYEPGERFLILRAPTGGRAEAARWLVGQIGAHGLEVRNGSVLGGDFRLGNRSADPSRPEGGEVLHVLVVEGVGGAEISREDLNRLHDLRRATPLEVELVPDDATDNDAVVEIDPLPDDTTQPDNEVPATTLSRRLVGALKDNVIHVLGISMVLGGCDASQAPTAAGIVAALGAVAAAARRVFGNRSLEAARTNSPAEPVVHETEVAAPTTEETLRSMTSRWDQLPNLELDRNNFAAAYRDAEELGRMAGRMPMENDATQAAYMDLVANLWATGNETLRNHLRPVMENAGTTLRPNIIRSLALRVMRSRDSLRTAANLATFLPPAMRGDVYESFVDIPGGLSTLLNLHRAAITAPERARLANAAARALLQSDSITLPMLRNLTDGVNFETLPAAAKLALDMRFHLEAAETAAQRRNILMRANLTAFERAALEEALLPRLIR